MLFISRQISENRYEVTDLETFGTDELEISEIKALVSAGKRVAGYTRSKIFVYKSLDEYLKTVKMKYQIAGVDIELGFDIEGGISLDRVAQNVASLKVPECVSSTYIGTFTENSLIEDITFVEGFKRLGSRSFNCCEHLKHIKLPNSLESMGKDVFYSCTSLEEIKFPEGIKYIGVGAFQRCEKLKTVILPETIKTICVEAFCQCSCLKHIDLPKNLTKIEKRAFCAAGLEHIEIPSSVKVIGENAFAMCEYLKSVKLNEGLERINSMAFFQCDISEIYLPESVVAIGNNVFRNCPLLHIHGKRGSYAEEYCKNNHIKFIEV